MNVLFITTDLCRRPTDNIADGFNVILQNIFRELMETMINRLGRK